MRNRFEDIEKNSDNIVDKVKADNVEVEKNTKREEKIVTYDKNGFDRVGRHKVTKSLYDEEGYNKDGYKREGYDRDGYNISGYNQDGYDREGFNKNRKVKYIPKDK